MVPMRACQWQLHRSRGAGRGILAAPQMRKASSCGAEGNAGGGVKRSQTPLREYFYYVDLHGRLYLDEDAANVPPDTEQALQFPQNVWRLHNFLCVLFCRIHSGALGSVVGGE